MSPGETPVKPESFLTISAAFKHIPYTDADRPDGDHCYPFAALKGASIERISAVAEVAGFEPLRSALITINDNATPFFTIGCEKDITKEKAGWRMGGYIEIAFNYADLVPNAANYFPPFFYFDRVMREEDFDVPIQVQWELTPSKFVDASDVIGYSAIVWVRTGHGPSRKIVLDSWSAAVDGLAQFLATFPTHGLKRIYPAQMKKKLVAQREDR